MIFMNIFLSNYLLLLFTMVGLFVFSTSVVAFSYINFFYPSAVCEYVSAEKRSLVANLPIAIFLTLGLTGLPWIAYFLWDWRLLSIVTSLPMAFAALTSYW